MRVFLAGRPEQYELFETRARLLQKIGLEVASTWHRNSTLADAFAANNRRQLQDVEAMRRDFFELTGKSPDKVQAEQTKVPIAATPSDPSEMPAILANPVMLESLVNRYKEELHSADLIMAELADCGLEIGYALALGKEVIAVGTLYSILGPAAFSRAHWVEDWMSALACLPRELVAQLIQSNESFEGFEKNRFERTEDGQFIRVQ